MLRTGHKASNDKDDKFRQSIEDLGIRVKNAFRLRAFCESLFRTTYLEMTFRPQNVQSICAL